MTNDYGFMSNFVYISGSLECDSPDSSNSSDPASLTFWTLLSIRRQVVVLTARSLAVQSHVLSSGFSGFFPLESSSPSSFSSLLSFSFFGFGTNLSTAIAFQAAKIQGVAWNAWNESSSPSSFSSPLSFSFFGFGTNLSTAIAFQAAKSQGVAWNATWGKFSIKSKQ